ncbi:MAG: EcsC family protein, partial [Bacteroidota bacterium]
ALSTLNDASTWTFEASDVLGAAHDVGIDADSVDDLRDAPLDELDAVAKRFTSQNTILSMLSGGGAGLGGALLLAADIPVLFTVNFRLIQQVAASYGFPLRGPEYSPVVVSIFNVAASGSREAKSDALRELSVAAAAFAHGSGYKGRKAQGTLREQMGHVPREIAKNLGAAKLGQMIPIAGAAVGAGVNYWFTDQTAQAAMMLSRALYLERKERL